MIKPSLTNLRIFWPVSFVEDMLILMFLSEVGSKTLQFQYINTEHIKHKCKHHKKPHEHKRSEQQTTQKSITSLSNRTVLALSWRPYNKRAQYAIKTRTLPCKSSFEMQVIAVLAKI
jgi:hypothetical protein